MTDQRTYKVTCSDGLAVIRTADSAADAVEQVEADYGPLGFTAEAVEPIGATRDIDTVRQEAAAELRTWLAEHTA